MTALLDTDLGSSLTFSDAELTAQALAADPDQPVDPDAVPFNDGTASTDGLLPEWYMPTPVGRHRHGWRSVTAAVIIVAFLVINAFGLCVTYGNLVPA
jgi:hypothetical protein